MVDAERRIVLAEGMIGQITIPLPPNPKRWWNDAKGRINPEGIAVTSSITLASIPAILPIEIGLTAAIHELSSGSPDVGRFSAVVFSGVANAASVSLERRALREKEYSASPVGTTLNIMTGRPVLSSVLEHLGNYAYLTTTNPINAVAIYNQDAQLLIDSLIATSLTLPLWYMPFNKLILAGKIDPFVNKMKSIRESISERIRKRKAKKPTDVNPAFIQHSDESEDK